MTLFEDIDVYTLLLRVCKRYSVHPSSSMESEDFFRTLLDSYTGNTDLVLLEQWLDGQIPKLFQVLTERPKWIQDPQWPFVAGQPMVFVGQVDYRRADVSAITPSLHDDSSFYVFIAPKSPPKVVMQQF